MIKPRVFLCNGALRTSVPKSWPDARFISLNTFGKNQNVNVRLEDVARAFAQQVSPRLLDLLEVASLIYAADTSTTRGAGWIEEGAVESWSRKFYFVIAVRDLDFWKKADITQTLADLIQFLSNDTCTFKFVPLKAELSEQAYLDFGHDEDWPFYRPNRVVMFSGGLDSLAGTVEMLKAGEKAVLVSHRSVGKIHARQSKLVNALTKKFPGQIIHIPVWINKEKDLGREHTQRTRSFLYASIGGVITAALHAEGVRFFENGIVSLNLPVADEVLQARASRTTHPISLEMLQTFLSRVHERNIAVDNPFIFLTKTDVIQKISTTGHADLIGLTSSCAHTWHQTKAQWHCGGCSQCIDRRIAVLAAGEETNDLDTDYIEDVFVGKRKEEYERNIAIDYVRHGIELTNAAETEIAAKFNLELTRAVKPFSNRRSAFESFVRMHVRHGEAVKNVLQRVLAKYAGDILDGTLEKTSMLAMIAGQQHQEPNWLRFCCRITALLRNGLPIATKSHKPKDEPHLQEICDGIFKAHQNELTREFPFMQWSSSLTKPDWSNTNYNIWIELKYVRKKYGVRTITEDIAADITKYGDQGVRVLFIIYDPEHVVTDEAQFSAPIHARPTMRAEFIR